jgi:integrase
MSTEKLPSGIERRRNGYRYRWTEASSGERQYSPTYERLEDAKHLRLWVLQQDRKVFAEQIADGKFLQRTLEEAGELDKTFAACADGWLKERRSSGIKDSSFREYEWIVNRCASIANEPVDKLDATAMNALRDRLMRKYKPLTVLNTIRTARAIVGYAVANRIIVKDPAPRYRYGKGLHRTRVHRYLTGAEYLAIREAARDDTARLMFELMWHTGMRVGEVLGLRVEQVDLKDDEPSILINWTRRPNGGYGPTKSGKPRTAILDDVLADDLRKHLANTTPAKYVFPSRYKPQESWSHTGFRVNIWEKAIDGAIAAGGLSLREGRPTAHDLRHSFASHMLREHPLKDVSELLGHASEIITAEVYSHRVKVKDDRTKGTMRGVIAPAEKLASAHRPG